MIIIIDIRIVSTKNRRTIPSRLKKCRKKEVVSAVEIPSRIIPIIYRRDPFCSRNRILRINKPAVRIVTTTHRGKVTPCMFL